MGLDPALHVVDDAGDDPAAPLVVIVHGAMDRSASFGRVARQLRHLHLIRYDRRGYGRSREAGVGSLDQHATDLLAVIDGRPAVVFGHSIGGVIALVAAQQAPHLVASVLAYEAPMTWASWWPKGPATLTDAPSKAAVDDPDGAADEAEAFMRRAIGDHFWSRLPARTRADRRAEGDALRADIASLGADAPYDAATLAVPVLAAAGADTTWWHERATRELAATVPGAEHAVVAGAGHGVHLTHPTALAHLIERAVERAVERAGERSGQSAEAGR